MAEVIPAILENNFPAIENKIRLVENYVQWVQIDIADDTLVNNTTYCDTKGYSALFDSHLGGGSARPPGDLLQLELHMMVKDPLKYLQSFIDVGFKRFFAHVEADNVVEFVVACQEKDVEVGLAVDGPTPIEKVIPYVDDLDVVLIMAIDAGQSGRPFREDTIEKIKKFKEVDFDLPLAVDGAMNLENARKVVAAGATRINSNSFIYNSPNIEKAISSLKELI